MDLRFIDFDLINFSVARTKTAKKKKEADYKKAPKLLALIERFKQLEAELTDPQILNLFEDLIKFAELTDEQNAWLRKQCGLKAKNKDPKDPKPPKDKDVSSEKDRPEDAPKKPANTGRTSFKYIETHQTIIQNVAPGQLPKNSVRLPDQEHVFRGIKTEPHNILIKIAVYKDPEGNIIKASLPDGYKLNGGFTPELRAELLCLKHECGMTQTGIKRFLEGHDIDISSGSISNILLNDGEIFLEDRDHLRLQALAFFDIHQFDDTGGIVEGKNWHTHILNNSYYAVYDSRERKDRLTLIDVFMGREKENRSYRFVEETWDLMRHLRVSEVQIRRIKEGVQKYEGIDLNQQQMEELVKELYPEEGKLEAVQRGLWDAGALTYYHQQEEVAVPKVVMSDNATQFELVFLRQALCWVHEGRRYKMLSPACKKHEELLDKKLKEFWEYYEELQNYKKEPSEEKAEKLQKRFQEIFGEETGYDALDKRLKKTLENRTELLVALERIETPLHNNLSELGARVKARSRDISLHSKSKRGAKVTDAMMSIVETARRLGVKARDYILERLTGKTNKEELFEMVKAEAS